MLGRGDLFAQELRLDQQQPVVQVDGSLGIPRAEDDPGRHVDLPHVLVVEVAEDGEPHLEAEPGEDQLAQQRIDEDSRQTSAVYYAYMLHAITDAEIRSVVSGIPRRLAPRLAHLVSDVDALVELESLIAMASGLAVGVLVGSYTADEAVAFVDHRLDRLFA